ncbi:MAG: hydroxymethylbilane synthase [Sphingomonadales bacterium]|nr:hydroxymethylbilane synthase [Sphingomonadales bacterium]
MPDSPLTLRLGTRRSPLAMAQAEEARDRLQAAHAGLAIEIVPVTASGDKVLDRPLAEIGGKALWTKELDQWLWDREIDFAVHSLKDVETLRPDWLAIAAVLPREDVRDALVGAPSIAALAPGARIGTSAPRRAAQLLHLRPDCRIVPFRGNVATRLGKLAAGEADATLLACAGLNRLGQAHVGHALDPAQWLPAPGQGAIAIECRADDDRTRALLGAIDDAASRQAVLAERAVLAALGGNCHSAVAIRTEVLAGRLHIHAALFSPDGRSRIDGEVAMPPGDEDAPRRLAAELLRRAPDEVRALFTGAGAG